MDEIEINIDISTLEEAANLQKDALAKVCASLFGYLDQYSELLLQNMNNMNKISKMSAQAKKDITLLMGEFNQRYSKLHKDVELIIAILDADANRITQGKTQDQIYSDYRLRNQWQQLKKRSELWNNNKKQLENSNGELQQYVSIINFMNGNLSNLDNDIPDNSLDDYGEEPFENN